MLSTIPLGFSTGAYIPGQGLTQLPDPFPIQSYNDGYDNANINSSGTITVNGRINEVYVAYVYKNGVYTELPTGNPGPYFSYAYEISDSNQILGIGGDGSSTIWDASGNAPIVATIPGLSVNYINGSNEMVGDIYNSNVSAYYINNGIDPLAVIVDLSRVPPIIKEGQNYIELPKELWDRTKQIEERERAIIFRSY